MPSDLVLDNGNPAGNFYDKYGSSNPIVKQMMRGFFDTVIGFARRTGVESVHEVGCGEGHLSTLLHENGFAVRGSDLSADVIDIATRNAASQHQGITYKIAGIEDLDVSSDGAPLVVCCEVLEHVEDPTAALTKLTQLASPYLLVSVPREPLWRVLNLCRGRYITAAGNTPGHIQHWSSSQFVNLLRQHVEVIDLAQPLPWTVALCKQ